MPESSKADSIWLEMENARVTTQYGLSTESPPSNKQETLQIQIKGDRTDKLEQHWWPVVVEEAKPGGTVHDALKTLFEALEKKRVVLAELKAQGNALVCSGIRIQYSESERR